MSVWANLAGHFSSRQAACVEVRQEEIVEGMGDTNEQTAQS